MFLVAGDADDAQKKRIRVMINVNQQDGEALASATFKISWKFTENISKFGEICFY